MFRHCRQGSIQTRRRYKEAVCRFCYFLAEVYHVERVANIAPKHIYAYTEFLKENRRAASTIKTDLAAIRFFHDQLPSRKHSKLPTNAMLDLERRSFGKVDRTWRDEEVNRMIGKAWGKVRTVPLPRTSQLELEAILRQTQRGHKLFVSDATPTDLAINRFQCFLYRHRDAVQIADRHRPLTCHGLRHTYAVEQYLTCRKQGLDEHTACRQVSRLLGHEREDVTRIYLASLREGGERHG